MECQCYSECKDCAPGFQKLFDLKNAGLVIYRHTTHIEDVDTKTGNVKFAVGTAEDIYILHNTTDKDVSSADYWPEIEQNTIKCPRCKQIKDKARKLLKKGPTIRGNNVMGICDNCKMKDAPCYECQEVVKSIVPSKLERTDVGKERVKLWLGKIKILLDDKSKDKKLAHFDINTDQLCPNLKSDVCEPIVEQLFGPHKLDSDSTIHLLMDKKKLIHYPQLEKLEHPVLFKDPLKKSGMSSLVNDDWEFSDSDISKSMLHAQPQNVTHSITKYNTESNNREVVAHMQYAAKFEDIFKDEIPLTDSKQKATTIKTYGDVTQGHGRDKTDFEPTETKQSSLTAKDGIEKTSFKPDKQATKYIYGRPIKLPDDNGQLSNEANLTEKFHITKVKDSQDGRQRQYISTENLVTKVKDITICQVIENKIIFAESSLEFIKDTAHTVSVQTKENIVQKHKQAKQQSNNNIYIINKIPDEIIDTDNIEKVKIEKNSSRIFDLSLQHARKGQKSPDLAEKTQKDVSKATSYASMLKAEKNVKIAEKDSQQAKKDAHKAALIAERNTKAAEKESQQAKKDAQKAALIAEKNAKAAEKESQKAKKDAQKATLIAEKNAKAAEKESQQAKKDAQKAALITEKNAKAAEKESQQAKKDAQKAALITEKNAKAAEKESQQAKKDAQKAALITEKNAKAAEKEQAKKDAQKPILITENNAKATETEQAKIDNRQAQNDSQKAASIAEINAAKADKSATKTEIGVAKTKTKTKTEKGTAKTEKEEEKAQKSALISENNAKKAENDALQAEKDVWKANYEVQKQAEKAVLEALKAAEEATKEKPRKDDKIIKVSCDSVIEMAKPENKKDNNRMKHANLGNKVKASSPGNLFGTDGEWTVAGLDDLIPKLVKLKQLAHEGRLHHISPDLRKTQKYMEVHCAQHTYQKKKHCLLCSNSDIALEFASLCSHNEIKEELNEMIVGQHILKFRSPRAPTDDVLVEKDTEEHVEKPRRAAAAIPDAGTCYWQYSLSNRKFIDNGWTQLPTEKVVRKINVYRMRPARPEFDWFEHNKKKGKMQYDTGEKLAEFDENGRGRWFYRNGRMALVYYDAEEQHAGQRFVIYSNGEPDERGRSRPYALLATFDYLGNGIVFDHGGKIRLKYNQTEGVVLDRSIGPVSHWKWHTLNDPPVLQQVMIDTQIPHKDPLIMNMGKPGENKPRQDDEDMLAIEFDNIVKEKSKKLSQAFKPFQIKMKALKINEHFSLRVLDQASVYLLYRDGKTNLKLNIGMVLDNKEIVDTDTADVGDVSNNLEKLPARTESLAGLQKSIAIAQQYDKMRTERERKLHLGEQNASIDKLNSGISRPIPRQLITTVSSDSPIISAADHCKCNRKPNATNVYYDTRFF